MKRRTPRLPWLALPLLAACQRPHVCGGSCEAGLVETSAAAAATVAQEAEQEPPARELSSAEALAAFDEAWQTIHDTHFDPKFNGVDWDALRDELRPRAERATTRSELREVLGEMLARLGQSHFVVIPSDALPDDASAAHDQSGGLGFDVRLREGQLLVTRVEPKSSAAEAGVAPGWSVRRIGSFDVGETLERTRAAEHELGERRIALRIWSAASGHVLGAPGGCERCVFMDGGMDGGADGGADGGEREVELVLERRARAVTAHEVGTTLPTFYLEFHQQVLERGGKKVGLIRFSNWFLPVMQPLNAALEGMRGLDGIVLDLRGNTGGAGVMTMGVAGHFFAETRKLGVMTTRDSTLNILAIPRTVNAAGEPLAPFAGPLAILTDETTGSASEVFAGGMQALGRARVFGETSAGAVLPAMTTRLPNGDSLLHALGDFETSTGARLEGVGVVPDEPVPLRRADLLAGRDAPLEAALAWITSRAHGTR